MDTDQVHLERRASQRFDFHLPVTVRLAGTDREGCGFTQDLSGRGAFFYTDFQVTEGDEVELTLVMPFEITLSENMRVRCRGKVLRVLPSKASTAWQCICRVTNFCPRPRLRLRFPPTSPGFRVRTIPCQPEKNAPIPGSSSIAVEAPESGQVGNR